MNCEFCNKYFNHIGAHERCCELNPLRQNFIDKLKASSEVAAKLKQQVWEDKFIEVKNYILKNGGTCLTTEYGGYNKKIKVKCAANHIWEVTPYSLVVRENWCKKCYTPKTKIKIEDLKIIAEERFGKCLSDKYENAGEKLLWECYFKHQWLANPNQIKLGSWCPTCSSGLYERICRFFIETIFNKPFPKIRPKWLIGVNKSLLEHDGYCEELNIAFEHNGSQHYNDLDYFNNKYLKQNDIIKKELCIKNGTKLIIIPELCTKLKLADLKNYIIRECEELKINLPATQKSAIINYNEIYKTNADEIKLEKIKSILKSKNMEFLDKRYLGVLSFGNVKCLKCESIYCKLMNYVLNGFKCSYCRSKGLLGSEIKLHLEKYNCKLLSVIDDEDKITYKKILECQCLCGNKFLRKRFALMKNCLCRSCSTHHNRFELIKRIEFSAQNEGYCLDIYSKYYEEISRWRCKNNHEFELSFKEMRKRKFFCRFCTK